MKVLHLLAKGDYGGIEVLLREYSEKTSIDSIYMFCWGGGMIADSMIQAGKSVIILNKEEIGIRKLINSVISICKEKEIDVIVTHNSSELLRIAPLFAKKKKPNLSIVNYVHQNAYTMGEKKNRIKGSISKWIQKYSLQKSNGIIAISDFVKRSLENRFRIDPTKITVIYNGVSLKKFKRDSEIYNLDEPIKLIYVGRLIKEKGVQIILDVISKIKDIYQVSFVIVGDGPFKNELMQLCNQLLINNYVSFVGAKNDVPNYLRNSDIFISIPSLEEGFGITIIEAMACGLICICSNSGAIPEIITNNIDGFIIERNNATQLFDTLIEIINNKPEHNKLIRKAAEQKASQFDIETYCLKMDMYLNDLIHQRKTYDQNQ